MAKGATFAFVTLPAQDLMYDYYCSGLNFNKIATVRMNYGRVVTRKDCKTQVAAQLSYRAWIYAKGDKCPPNKLINTTEITSFCVLHEYQEKSLLYWAAGESFLYEVVYFCYLSLE